MGWNSQTQHCKSKSKEDETNIIEESEVTYESIMQKIAESKGLTIEEMTKENFEFVQESLLDNQGSGLTEEDLHFIKERLEKER